MLHFITTAICALFLSPTLTTQYQNGAVGVQIEIPADAMVVATSSNPPSCLITGGNSSNIWHLRLDRGGNASHLSPQELVSRARQRRSDPAGTKVMSDTPMRIGDQDGWWLLLSQPSAGGETVIGWLVIPAPGEQYLMASIMTNRAGWQSDGRALLDIIASIKLLDPVALMTQKIQGLDAATKFLSNLNKATLRPLIGFQEWRRIQTQQDAGIPVDIGYASVSIGEGYAHETNLKGQQEMSEPKGLVITLRSRILLNPDTRLVVDTNAQYWMSWDGKECRWWNRITRWIDRAKIIESETGIRSRPTIGNRESILLVFQENLMASTIETPFKATAKDPWLPRPLVWILGPLLVSQDTTRYEWYTFDNTGEKKIILRTDTLTKGEDGTTTIETRFGTGGDIMSTIIDHTGHLIVQRQAGGVLVKGSTEQELRSIWMQRGLW